MTFVLADPHTKVLECGPMEVEFRFSRPLWPGNRTYISLRWSAPETCSVDAAAKQGQDIIERLRNQGDNNVVPNRVTVARKADPAAIFRQEAKASLEL